jgi:glycosyltransferase involved in cell wall biosynthesis
VASVHVVVPDGIDDPARPSGGNAYDRRLCRGLTEAGWSVHQHTICGDWPRPDPISRADLVGVLSRLPAGAIVLLDGMIASTLPDVLLPEADRLRLVVLLHMPIGDAGERAVLARVAAIVTTSVWSRHWLLDRHGLRPETVHVAEPGVDVGDIATGTASGDQLLCVAAVIPDKGHDVLVDAIAQLDDVQLRCVCVGSLARDPAFVTRLRRRLRDERIEDRVHFTGPLGGADLDAAYAAADVLVLASRAETYGMAVAEALARGLPVIATEVGGLPQTLGHAASGGRPGLLVPPDDPAALAGALRAWLSDAELRAMLRRTALESRTSRVGWSETVDRVVSVLAGVATEPGVTGVRMS